MKKIPFLLAIIIMFITNQGLSATTASVIIPCYYGHFKYIPILLEILSKQTVLPEEVIISLSEVEKVNSAELAAIEQNLYPFELKIIKHRRKLYAGQNRQSASQVAIGDILIYQDADDIPHNQRIEIIKYFFDNYDIVHLMHCFIFDSYEQSTNNNPFFWGVYDKTTIPITKVVRLPINFYPFTTNGNTAIKKNVLKEVFWTKRPQGEDVIFNEEVFTAFRKTAIIDANLLIYRNHLSSWKTEEIINSKKVLPKIKNTSPSRNSKLLVLIIASDHFPVYTELEKIWQSYMHYDPEHVEAYFIKADPNLKTTHAFKEDVIWSQSFEGLSSLDWGYKILEKTLIAMEAIMPRIQEFDYILRTNLSSFYIFPRLLKFLETLPKTNCYCGSDIGGKRPIGSGCGFIMSPDIVKMLVNNKKILLANKNIHSVDDVIIGRFLNQNSIKLIRHERLDILTDDDWREHITKIPSNIFHLRVKFPDHVRVPNEVKVKSQLLHMFYK